MGILKRVNTGVKYVARKDGTVRVLYSDGICQKFVMIKGENLTVHGDHAIYEIKE